MKRIGIILIVITLIAVSVVNSFAVNDSTVLGERNEDYIYTTFITAKLSINSQTATCRSTAMVTNGVSKIVLSQKLQKKSGSTFTTIKMWTKTVYTTYADYTNTKSSLPAGVYRVQTVAKVYYTTTEYERAVANSATETI